MPRLHQHEVRRFMLKRLNRRAEKPEMMDDLVAGGKELREALQHLQRLNRIFGAARPVLFGVRRLWSGAGAPRQLSLLDIGSGSGDINRLLFKWADRHKIQLHVTLSDVSEAACEEARRLYKDEPRIRVKQWNLFNLPESCADIVTASQLIHHFPSRDLPRVIQKMLGASRVGIVISDIHRHWIPWLAVYALSRVVSRNAYIRHDGPLSVAKGFRAADWEDLKETGALGRLTYSWRPLFRYVVMIEKRVRVAATRTHTEAAGDGVHGTDV